MPNIDKIKIKGVSYNIKDSNSTQMLSQLNEDIVNYNNTKVGYAEYSDSYLSLYSDSTKEHLIAKLLIEDSTGLDTSYKNQVYPANMIFPERSGGFATSVDTFNFSNCFIVNMVVKNTSVGNIYNAYELFGLYKDNNNYFRIYVSNYNLFIEYKIDGVTKKKNSYSNSDSEWTQMVQALDYLYIFDYPNKRFLVKTSPQYTNEIKTTFNFDLSEFNLSELDYFKIRTEVGQRYTGATACKYFCINSYIDFEEYINQKLLIDNYAPFTIETFGTTATTDVIASASGTVLETISSKHKKYSFSQTSQLKLPYYKTGCLDSIGNLYDNQKLSSIFKFKFSDITTQIKICTGASVKNIYIFDEYLNTVTKIDGFSSSEFYPEEGKWYIEVITLDPSSTQGISYMNNYGHFITGEATLELEAIAIAFPQKGIISSANYNGTYFTSPIGFTATGIQLNNVTNTDSISAKHRPIGALKVDTNGNIQMWNGFVYKTLNNQ